MTQKYKLPRDIYLKARIYVDSVSECWIWTLARDKDGYGVAHKGKKNIRAHRASYETFVGPIPKGLDILHKCDNPPCCNPEHLFPGTNQENMDDMVAKGRKPKKSHCPQCHLYTHGNIYIQPDGSQKCKICVLKYHKIRYLKRKLAK